MGCTSAKKSFVLLFSASLPQPRITVTDIRTVFMSNWGRYSSTY